MQVRLAGGVIDRRHPLGQHGSHQDIRRSGHGSLVEQHISAFQLACLYLVYLPLGVVAKASAQLLDSHEVRVQPASPDLVATRFRDQRPAEAGYQRAYDHHGTPQATTLAQELLSTQILHVHVVRLKGIGIGGRMLHLDPHIPKELD